MTDDERKIRALVAEWMRASAAGETDKVLALMADDVVFMVPGRKPFGKKEFADASRAMAGQVKFAGKSEIVELQVLGDWAWCIASFGEVRKGFESGGFLSNSRGTSKLKSML